MDLKAIRHYLHQHPEVSGKESRTAKFIIKKLKELGIRNVHTDFSKTAVLAEIDGKQPGKTVLFRCELDALPIQEVNDELEYKSICDGVSHKCGHDGHMTIILGLAEALLKNTPDKGKVLLLFQPSEENGRGAKAILESGKLKEFDIDFVFALHNVPGFPMGSVVCKTESFTPSVESIDVHLKGKTSHAGMPDKGVNPAVCISRLIRFYQSLHQPEVNRDDYFLATPIQLQMGEPAYGTSAGSGMLSYTFRSYDHGFFKKQKEKIEKQTRDIVKKTDGLSFEMIWKEAFEANQNEEGAVALIKKAAFANELKYIEKEIGFSWGEDFGRLTREYPGAMFGLGSGRNQPELHNPDFDFPDELLEKGISMWYTLAKISLS